MLNIYKQTMRRAFRLFVDTSISETQKDFGCLIQPRQSSVLTAIQVIQI